MSAESGHFIALDWGTSCLRAFLCRLDESGKAHVLERSEGVGVGRLTAPIEAVFAAVIAPWVSVHGPLPAVLAGMVGSNIGWVTTPYRECPVAPVDVARDCVRFEFGGQRLAIVPGVSCGGSENAPDFMRGEELQILGWMNLYGVNLAGDDHLLCLPGTHTKWVLVRNGKIETFFTALTGELFALLRKHSVLVPPNASTGIEEEVFQQGVEAAVHNREAGLIHQLFGVRSRQLRGDIEAREAASYLSGLLIGADVAGAAAKFQTLKTVQKQVTLIGEPALCQCFAHALRSIGYGAETAAVTEVTLAGFATVYKQLFAGGVTT